MASLSWQPFMANELPDHCAPATVFLANFSALFDVCVPSYLALLSTVLGTLSIFSWLCAQLPQIFKNYNLKSTAGLSMFFLIEWCLGDATNLLGAIFTRQATWQVIIASYYLFVDLALVVQYFWLTYYKPGLIIEGVEEWDDGNFFDGSPTASMSQLLDERLEGDMGHDEPDKGKAKSIKDEHSQPKDVGNKAGLLVPDYAWPQGKGTPSSSSPRRMPPSSLSFSPGPSPKTAIYITLVICLASIQPTRAHPSSAHPGAQSTAETRVELAGRLLSWVSTALYLGSRLPQLYKNQTRRSTAGLSPALFIAAFFGNLFYSASLIANPCAWADYPPYGAGGWVGPEGNRRWEWVGRAAPFWLGAAGVLALDAAVGVQFLVFGEGEEKEVAVKEGGRWHWRRVSGWMRGWVPSVSPRRGRSPERHAHREGDALIRREASGAAGYGAV